MLVLDALDWQHAHTLTCARPSIEWPTGLPIATAAAEACAGHDVRVIDITQL